MNKWKKGYLGSFVIGLVLASLLLSPNPVRAQKVVIAQGFDADTLDANAVFTTFSFMIFTNIFDGLLTRDRDWKLNYRLATGYKLINPTKWRVNLRKGVSFHNGEPFNAESVKFTVERINAPDYKSMQKSHWATIDRVEVVDEYTVDIITKKPDPLIPAKLTYLFPVPPKYVKEVGDAKFGQNPIGTGPFQFVKWIKDDRVELKGYEKYWEGPPQVKELIFRAVPEIQARLAALQAGEVDIATHIPPDLAEPLMNKKGDFQFKEVTSSRVVYLNLSPIPAQVEKGSPLMKKEVRQAINYAIDMDSIIKHVLKGGGERVPTIVPKGMFAYDSSLKPYPYDPKKAKELLVKAGFPNGFELEVSGPTGRFTRDKEITQAIGGQLEKVGIKANIKIYEWGTYLKLSNTHVLPSPYIQSWSLISFDPDQYMWVQLHSGEFLSQTNDKELDRILEEARVETDVAKREKLYHQAQRISYDQGYLAALYQQKNLFGVSKRIDWVPRGDDMIFGREIRMIK
jgi:peptide/nickel transport system substrate-binding protein